MKAAMAQLAAHWPLPIPFVTLLSAAREALGRPNVPSPDDARHLATRLLNLYTAGMCEFSLSHPTFVTRVSERPVASAYARLRAAKELKVTNLRLESVGLTEPSRLILRHLDGQHDRAALTELLTAWLKTHSKADESRAGPYVEQLLQAFAHGALLTA
jgi:methyltransferase-like protein